MSNIVEAENLSVSYAGKAALRSVSFAVGEGETLAVVGESGSGKSTLLRAIMGLLPRSAFREGMLRMEGCDLAALSPREHRAVCGRGVTMVFQDSGASFCPVRTVGAQIVEAVQSHEADAKKSIMERASSLMGEIGLDPSVLSAYPFELSGGMAQRVGILAAMVLAPRLLLADEPTASLDCHAQEQVLDLLLRLKASHPFSMILVTHDMGVARHMADRILVMRAGKIVEIGTREEIFAAPKCAYTKALLAAMPMIRKGIGKDGICD